MLSAITRKFNLDRLFGVPLPKVSAFYIHRVPTPPSTPVKPATTKHSTTPSPVLTDKRKMTARERLEVELESRLTYVPASGTFFWKRRPVTDFTSESNAKRWNSNHACLPAGCLTHRYPSLRYRGYEFVLSRLACRMMYGYYPKGRVLYRDGNPQNLKASNLLFPNN